MSLGQLSALSALLIQLVGESEELSEKLKALNERIRVLKEESIPSVMQELELQSIKLSTGETLSVSQEVYASIPVANRPAAFAWLEERGFGGLIKTAVEAEFQKGEIDRAKEILKQLQEQGVQARLERNVHPQTLKAFIKEQLAEGSDIPLDTFGARPTMTTKIKKGQ